MAATYRSVYGKPSDLDIEAGPSADMLYPGIVMADNALRWGFLQKVYGIVSAQLLITAIVVSLFTLLPSVNAFVLNACGGWVFVAAMLLPFIGLIPLYIYRYSHPMNLGFLGLWTACMSVTVGVVCTFYQGPIVLEALIVTAAVVLGLTAYTFYAAKRGHDFSAWGAMLGASLLALIVWGFIQMFFNPGPAGRFVFALIGALIFSLYIIYDTDNIIKRYSYDEYVWASVGLYLDIVNLFIRLLEIFGYLQRSS